MLITYIYEDKSIKSFEIKYSTWQQITSRELNCGGYTVPCWHNRDIATSEIYDELIIKDQETIKYIYEKHQNESVGKIKKIKITDFT